MINARDGGRTENGERLRKVSVCSGRQTGDTFWLACTRIKSAYTVVSGHRLAMRVSGACGKTRHPGRETEKTEP